ncbi:MAG: hypothetical protein FJW40_14780 [Acidobacteria bacterium]|nr:hypothetical protein [Acidobacteriota bacterium]
MRPCLFAALAVAAMAADDFPSARISNGVIDAHLYLPDAERGYYRGTRFDWSGQISSLRTKNHEYFGQWFPRYDPTLHDSIMGPVEEFRTRNTALGFEEAAPGGVFIRIGIGALRKPDASPFQAFRTYDIVDPGRWRVKTGRNQVTFTHELAATGYAYRYTKTVRLEPGQPVMVIQHVLRNTGRRRIETEQYNHNFFVMDKQKTGPATSVRVPWELKPVRAFSGGVVQSNGGLISYTREQGSEDRVIGEFTGAGPTAADYDFHLENKAAGAGVHITADIPLFKLVYWSIPTVFSPEPYVRFAIDPGKEFRWTYRYRFYDLPAAP